MGREPCPRKSSDLVACGVERDNPSATLRGVQHIAPPTIKQNPLRETLAPVVGAYDFVVVGVIQRQLHYIAFKAVVACQCRESAAPAMRCMLASQAKCHTVDLLDGFTAYVTCASW